MNTRKRQGPRARAKREGWHAWPQHLGWKRSVAKRGRQLDKREIAFENAR